MPDPPPEGRRLKVWTPEELPEGPLREAARYDPRRDRGSVGRARSIIDQIRKTGRDIDGAPLACDFCLRPLRVRKGFRINGGYFPTGAQARADGLYTWFQTEEKSPDFGRRVGADILALVFYCWKCNRPKAGARSSRVDRAIRAVRKEWLWEDFLAAPGDLGDAIRRCVAVGRIKEFGAPEIKGARA